MSCSLTGVIPKGSVVQKLCSGDLNHIVHLIMHEALLAAYAHRSVWKGAKQPFLELTNSILEGNSLKLESSEGSSLRLRKSGRMFFKTQEVSNS